MQWRSSVWRGACLPGCCNRCVCVRGGGEQEGCGCCPPLSLLQQEGGAGRETGRRRHEGWSGGEGEKDIDIWSFCLTAGEATSPLILCLPH